jgi:hypothetical protein
VLVGELLGTPVVDADGVHLGHVHDLRLVQDGPIQGSFGAGFRVQGLIVGPPSLASRLGYDRRNVRGPTLVAHLARRSNRAVRYVSWTDVADVASSLVRLRVVAEALEPPVPLGGEVTA